MSRGKLLKFGVLLIVSIVLWYYFPLFHIRPLGESLTNTSKTTASNQPNSKVADPATYVDDFWNGRLRKGEGATEITQLWQAFDADAAKAKKDHGRQVGLGGSFYFCVRGRGTVETIAKNRCTIIVPNESRLACLELGVIVDNTVREAIGVNVNEFANSQDFNAVSSELNLRVEQEVIKPNKDQLKPGAAIEFIGCAKIGGESDLDPLCLVPIHIEVVDSGTAE